MTKIGQSYRALTVVEDKDGALILTFPPALLRDFGAHTGDTVTLTMLKSGSLIGRFYRQTKIGWVRLEHGRTTRPVERPR